MTYGRTDYERMAGIYDSGRALPHEWLEAWRNELEGYLPYPGATMLDLGSGTGLWTDAFSEWFAVRVIAVEPSDGMRRTAAAKGLAFKAMLVGGTAEGLPLRDGACECAWLSTVVHHITDLAASVAELHRVLAERGVVLIRNSFGDRLEGINWLEFFPAAREVARRRWPSVEATAEAFGAGGFNVEVIRRVPEIVASGMAAYLHRIEVRAISTLTLISDEDFEEGLARMRHAAERQTKPAPIVDLRDLLVLRKVD
jgi:ubiquinone/menaquinone biosynthesis C-methylase UbiE